MPAAAREPARDLGPDARRRSGDDRDLDHGRHLTRPLGSPGGRRLHRQARARARRRKQALDRVGDCAGARRRRRRLAFTYQGERIEKSVRDLARRSTRRSSPSATCGRTTMSRACSARSGTPSAASSTSSFTRSPSPPPRTRGPLHRHAARPLLARGRRERLFARRVRARAEPLMEKAGGGSIVTMTYLGGERAVPHYNVMGVAKATLDASMRYLAWTSARRTSASTRSLQARCGRSPPARSPASDDGGNRRGARSVAPACERGGRRRRRGLSAGRWCKERDRNDAVCRLRLSRNGHVGAGESAAHFHPVEVPASRERSRAKPASSYECRRRSRAARAVVAAPSPRARSAVANGVRDGPVDGPVPSVYENGLVTMSATTSRSTATSKRAISRMRLTAASVSGAVGPFDSDSAAMRLACGERTPMPMAMLSA